MIRVQSRVRIARLLMVLCLSVDLPTHLQPFGKGSEAGAVVEVEVSTHLQPFGKGGEAGAAAEVEPSTYLQPFGKGGEGGTASEVEPSTHLQPFGKGGEGGAGVEVEIAAHLQPFGKGGEGGTAVEVEISTHLQPFGEGGAVVEGEISVRLPFEARRHQVHDVFDRLTQVNLGHAVTPTAPNVSGKALREALTAFHMLTFDSENLSDCVMAGGIVPIGHVRVSNILIS